MTHGISQRSGGTRGALPASCGALPCPANDRQAADLDEEQQDNPTQIE